MEGNSNHVKLFFYHDAFDTEGIESAWGEIEENGYRLENILFYAKEYSFKDVVSAEEKNGVLCVTGLMKESGHSTVRVLAKSEEDVSIVRQNLKIRGCDSELSNIKKLFAVDIPPSIEYSEIIRYLENGFKYPLDYQEACISTVHRSQ